MLQAMAATHPTLCAFHADQASQGWGPSPEVGGAQALLERYFELLPQVCGCEAEALHWKRLLFAGQPCYRSAPTQPHFDRVLQVRPQTLHPKP